jgi:two-component system cell cycle sensor histidine kinase/response regulator CckA
MCYDSQATMSKQTTTSSTPLLKGFDYGIVKQSEGFIWVDSRIGRGTTVHILFPIAVEELANETAPAEEEEMKGRDESILIIEDEDAVRKMVARILKRLGYSVLEAGSGQDALKLLETRRGGASELE